MSKNNTVENNADIGLKALGALIFIIILGNIMIEPPMLFHHHGHFGIITHPIDSIKDLFWGWGYNQKSFIFSLKGLQSYFNSISFVYHKYGFLKATFAYFTQFSPVWAFIPLKLLYDTFVELMSNNDVYEADDNRNMKGADNE